MTTITLIAHAPYTADDGMREGASWRVETLPPTWIVWHGPGTPLVTRGLEPDTWTVIDNGHGQECAPLASFEDAERVMQDVLAMVNRPLTGTVGSLLQDTRNGRYSLAPQARKEGSK